jgi:tetratricopeptide (TPR) repeat protein
LLVVLGVIGVLRFGKMAVITLVLMVILGGIIPNPIKQRAVEVAAQDPFAFSRLDIWGNAVQRIIDHPWGVGLGQFKYDSFRYRFPVDYGIARYGKRAESAHNEYLQIGAELGVVGLVLFLFGVAAWGRETWRAIVSAAPDSWEKGIAVGLAGAVLAILIHGLVDSVFHEPAVVLLLILAGTMAMRLATKKDGADLEDLKSVPFPYHPLRAAVIGLVGVIMVGGIAQPAAGWYLNERGQAESTAGDPEGAYRWFKQAAFVDPGSSAYYDALGRTAVRLFWESGKIQWLLEAVDAEEQAAAINPIDGRPPYRIGTLYSLLAAQNVSAGNQNLLLARASAAFEHAIALDPYSPLNYWELGNLLLRQGRTEEARQLYARSRNYEPNFLPSRARLAELALEAGEIEYARREYREMTAILKKFERWTLSETERDFINVDLYPLGRALALKEGS